MQRSPSLDDFIPRDEDSSASFHDADLLALRVDYERKEAVSEWELCVGDPLAADEELRERRRRGRLKFTGLVFWATEPPDERYATKHREFPLLTAEGPLRECPTSIARRLAAALPPGLTGWYLYFSDLNAFTYCASEAVAFEWVE